MKHNKVLIILIIVFAILILSAGGFVLAYMTTDILKTDQQLFYKYIFPVGKDIVSLNSENLQSYMTKLETSPYENNGSLTVAVTAPDSIYNQMNLDAVNNMEITFNGKEDKSNKLSEQNININYSEEVTMPISYKATGDTYGLTSESIVNGIIAIKDENLQEFAQKLGINVQMPDKIGVLIPNITEEQIANEIPKLEQIIINNLKPENFSKIDERDFALTLSQKQLATMVLQMIEEIKSSGMLSANTIEEINKYQENIQIENLSDEEFLKLVVSKDKRLVISIEEEIIAIIKSENNVITIQLTDEENAPIITLQKLETENNLSYKIGLKQENNEISLTATYTGLQTQTANENYLLVISVAIPDNDENNESEGQKLEYQYNFDTSKTFVDAVDVEELTSENAFILNEKINEYGAETIKALFQQIGTAIVTVNNEQMQKLGVSENPLIFATPIGYAYYSIAHTMDNPEVQMKDTAITSFNAGYLNYEGHQKGSSAKILIDRVITNNKDTSDHIVSVNGYTDESSLQNLKSQLSTSAEYNITFNYNLEGYINAIMIAAK